MLKLKRKLEFRGHVYFQAVRSQFIFDALNWLKLNNLLYNNITIDIKNINAKLASLDQDDSASATNQFNRTDIIKQHIPVTDHDDTEERDDPLNEYRQATNETCLQSIIRLSRLSCCSRK